MKGLLIKDFYVIKDILLLFLLTIVIVGTGISYLSSPWVLGIMASVILGMNTSATINIDKTAQWDKFAVTLPVSRKQVITSKYIIYSLLCLTGLTIGIVISIVVSILRNELDVSVIPMYVTAGIFISFVSGSVAIPCNFILSEEKSNIGVIFSYVVTAGIFVAYIFLADKFIGMDNVIAISIVGILLSGILYYISWMLSKKYISTKELL